MAQSSILAVRGLYTYPSDTSGVPLGSASVALNLNINRDGVIECRRGYGNLPFALSSLSDRLSKLFFWQSSIFGVYNTSSFAYYNPASGWSSRGTLTTPPNAVKPRAVSSLNKNLYLTSATGLQKTDAIANSIYLAGVPQALIMDLSLAGAGAAVANSQYATYQYLVGRKDANSNIQYGGTSGSFTIQNTSGSTQNITVRVYLPSGLNTSHFVQLYRSVDSATTPSPTDPQLTYEQPLTSTMITNGYVDITDVTPSAQLGATIYTSPNVDGIAGNNDMPPLASDIAEFKGYMFYADIAYKHVFTTSLLGVSATALQSGDTIIISDGVTPETYTAGASENTGTKTFKISTGGSAAQNIDATIKSFAKIVNLTSLLVTASVVPYSVINSFPGKINLEAKSLAQGAFTVTSARATAFSPQLATGTNTSTADTFRNGLAVSKANQPEACPRAQIFKVGAADDPILRIQPLRDGLMIYKKLGGVFVLRGSSLSDFQVTLLDNTAKLVSPESLGSCNNLAYGLFEAGICSVNDQNVRIISDRIKDQILPLFGQALAQLRSLTFGFGSDTDGKYVLSIPQSTQDTFTSRQIIYDVFNDTFVNWDLNLTCGGVNPIDDKSYLGLGTSNYTLVEKRAFDYTDFSDTSSAVSTITSYVGTRVFLNNTGNMRAGDLLTQSPNYQAYIESVDNATSSVIIDVAQTWDLNVANIVHDKGISCKWQWNADSGGSPAGFKQYYECDLIQKQAFQKSANLIFSTDINPAESTIPLTSSSGNGAFGQFDFGEEVFGGDQARSPKRIGIPQGMARCNQLSVRFETQVAWSDFQLTGLSLSFNPVSTRTTR